MNYYWMYLTMNCFRLLDLKAYDTQGMYHATEAMEEYNPHDRCARNKE